MRQLIALGGKADIERHSVVGCAEVMIKKNCGSRWNWNFDRTFVGLGTKVGRKPLMSVGQLRRFAAECEAMANGTRDPRDKQVWRGLAERWLRCAALIERDESDVRARRRDMPVLRKKDRGTIH